MQYKMYQEIKEQSSSLVDTLVYESYNMELISDKLSHVDFIYLVGSGSSLSTCFSVRDALNMISDLNIDVFTGFEFLYNKKIENKNAAVIFTSQSGETGDTVAALKYSKELGLVTIGITNEGESTIYEESDFSILTRCGKEEAILGTKTYITQLACLYKLLFSLVDSDRAKKIINQLNDLPEELERLINTTEEPYKNLAKDYKDEMIYYCLGSGANYGLAYKLAMTMMMEGAYIHACPLYSTEFRHGLIERCEEGVPHIFLDADYESDELTKKAINFANGVKAKTIVLNFNEFSDLDNLLAPFILVIPLEWFVYYLAHFNGIDPGSTRHIGKVRY